MKVLVTGVKGQLGYDVVNELTKRGIEAVGVDIQEMDITDAASVEKVIGEAAPDAVVHCAAYTAVDAAEDNVEICRKVIPLWLGMTIIISIFMLFPGLATWPPCLLHIHRRPHQA